MADKLFLITEVEAIEPHGADGKQLYRFVDVRDQTIRIYPERIIPASRLRYGPLERDGQIFWGAYGGWVPAVRSAFSEFPSVEQYLILDPPEPMDEWDKWVDEAPGAAATFKEWLRRMPRGGQ